MAENEVIETETEKTEAAEFDIDCWNRIKEQLDSLKFKYEENPEEGTFVLVYRGKQIFKTVFLNVFVKKGYYLCLGCLFCNILESQREAVDRYLMLMNNGMLYEGGKYVSNYENNLIGFNDSNSSPERVALLLGWVLESLRKIEMGFLAVSSAMLSAEEAAKRGREMACGDATEFFRSLQISEPAP